MLQPVQYYILVNTKTLHAITGSDSFIGVMLVKLGKRLTGQTHNRPTVPMLDAMAMDPNGLFDGQFKLMKSERFLGEESIDYLLS